MQLRFAQNFEVHSHFLVEAAGQAGGCGWELSVSPAFTLGLASSLGDFQGLFDF